MIVIRFFNYNAINLISTLQNYLYLSILDKNKQDQKLYNTS